MTEFCINTHDKLEIGEITMGEVFGPDGKQIVAVKILEEVTHEYYFQFCQNLGLADRIKRSIYDPKLKFYKVEILD